MSRRKGSNSMTCPARPVAPDLPRACRSENGRPKLSYTTERLAREAFKAVMANDVDGKRDRLRPYRCGDCGSWHLGRGGSDPTR